MNPTYVCTLVDDTTLDCLEWVQTASWPALSVQDATMLAGAVLACWVIAFGFRFLLGQLTKRY